MADTYLTIDGMSEGIYREKMSKFLAFAHHASSTEEAKAIIASYQKKYFDARHVCWAYMLGFERTDFQSNDNGEPSGTAGKPILGQINSFNLTDTVIVVVRYFGGIKLGTSGLIAAYREAARLSLENAQIVERKVMKRVDFTFPYLSMNDVMRTVKQSQLEILSQQFDNACAMSVAVRADDHPALISRLQDIDGVSIL